MQDTHSTKYVADVTGASPQIIRVYTNKFSRYFSTEATPGKGVARRFTDADLRLIAYIYQSTAQNITYDEIEERLQAGELDQFDWQPPETEQKAPESASGETYGALVPAERLQAAQVLLHDAQQREQAAIEREESLQAEIQQLREELGQARGELAGYKGSQYRAPAWWRAIFGGRAEE